MKVNNKFLNIESKSKKSQIEKEIHEFEDEKSKKIMQLGLSAYDKISSKVVKKEKFDIDNYEIDESEYEIDDEDESYRYADDEELDTIDSSVEIVNEEVLDSENEENRELYEEYNLENKESNKEEIEDNLKFDDQKIELTKKGN